MKYLPTVSLICAFHLSLAQWTGTNPAYITSGSVGIGTSTPNTTLDVNGGLRIRRQNSTTAGILINNGAITLRGWAGTPSYTPYIEWRTDADLRQGYMGWSNDRLSLKLENSFNFTVEGGKVGIGTTTPLETLHVNGTVRGHISGGALRVSTEHGYLDMGPMNTSWAHFQTDRAKFNFNKPATIDGLNVGRYGAAYLGDANPYVIHTTDAETHELLVFGSNTATVHLRVLDGDLKLGLNQTPNTILYNTGAASFGGAVQISTTGSSAMKIQRVGSNLFGYELVGTSFGFYDYTDQKYRWRVNAGNLYLMENGGNVGIGTTDPGTAKLAVNGTIHGEEVKVDLNVPGPDYVFEKDYRLPDLEELASYIAQNKHLPEIPSAKEMEANGIKLGEMNMLLLKKIEELTLHLIRQQVEIDELKKKGGRRGN